MAHSTRLLLKEGGSQTMTLRYWLAVVALLLMPAASFGGGELCASALNFDQLSGTFTKTNVTTGNENYWVGVSSTATYTVHEGGFVPPGSGFTAQCRAFY